MKGLRKHLYAVIMAGGGGERFWPKSRRAYPKQLHSLFGKRTMIQETARRISSLVPKDRLIVITNELQAPLIRRQLEGVPARSIIAEPFGRDTAPCVALGAAVVMDRDQDGIMIVLPADHVIRDCDALIANLRDACEVAWERDCLVTLGIKPTAAATGYGYIRRGRRLDLGLGTAFYLVSKFTEKPDAATARRYLRSGRYFWNSGMFVWKAAVIAGQLERHMPQLHHGYEMMRKAMRRGDRDRIIKKVYSSLDRISIDYGVMEKADDVVVAEASFDWDDVGSWLALERHLPMDGRGNVILGEGIAMDAERCIIVAEEGLVACHGVSNLIVVKTPDAVLVCHRDAAQDLKKVLQRLKGKPGWHRYI